MHTFLPYKDFRQSARALDNKTLDRQRVDAMQIMSALIKMHAGATGIPWAHHHATKMWQGHEHSLMLYQEAVCNEWVRRGNRDGMLNKTADMLLGQVGFQEIGDPPWLGLKRLHSSHRALLLHENYEYYNKFGWKEEPQEGCWWPVE